MSSKECSADVSGGQSHKPPVKNTPNASSGATPSGPNKESLNNPPANSSGEEMKQPPTQGNKGETKQSPAEVNGSETKQSPAQTIKEETKQPPDDDAKKSTSKEPSAESNKGETKQSPAETNKSETKQPPAEVNKSETKQPPAEGNKNETKQHPAEVNKGETKQSPAEGNKSETKPPPAEVNKNETKQPPAETKKGETIKTAAEGCKDTSNVPAEGKKGASKKPAVEAKAKTAPKAKPKPATPGDEAGADDPGGERKRYCGAARKRFKWLMSKGFSVEEARALASQSMQELQPIRALKRCFGDDEDDPAFLPKKKKLRKDRTFNEPSDVVKPQLGGIRVGIIAAGYPKTLLTSDQLTVIRDTVMQKLVPEKTGTFKPKFLGTSSKPGFIIFHCDDKATVLWLKTAVDKLKTVVDADLRVLEQYQIPRKLVIVGYFPNKKRENIMKLFEYIKEHNEGLNVDAWVLHKLITIKGVTQAIFAVDHQSASKLIEDNFKITFKNRIIELKPDVKFQKNVEATVYIPKDPKQGGSGFWNKWWNPKLPRPPKFNKAGFPDDQNPNMMVGDPHMGNAPIPETTIPPQPRGGAPSWPGANPRPWHQNQMPGNKPPFPVGPPQPPVVRQQWVPPSGGAPNSYSVPVNPLQNEANFGPAMMEPGDGKFQREPPNRPPPSIEVRDQSLAAGNYPNVNAPNQEMQSFGPQNRNPKYDPQSESGRSTWTSSGVAHSTRQCLADLDRPAWERRRDDYPNRVSGTSEPPRDASRERGSAFGTDRPPWASEDNFQHRSSAEDESLYDRRPHILPPRDSAETDRPHWGSSRGRYADRDRSASDEDRPRSARSRDRYSNRGSVSGAERRDRSRSRDSPDRRFETEADRGLWSRSRNVYSVTDAERPSRAITRDYSERLFAVEVDRRSRDASRDSYSNRESLTEAERPAYGRSREYVDRGPAVEADMHPRGAPQGDYMNREPAHEAGVPPRRMSPERYLNRAPTNVIRRPWDKSQESYVNQRAAVESDSRRGGTSREGYRGQAAEDEKPPWAVSGDRYPNRSEGNEPVSRESRDRFSNRGSISEDDRWGVSRDRSLNRDSAGEANRPQWGLSRDGSSRGRSRERRPCDWSLVDSSPWARRDIKESDGREWARSATDGNKYPGSTSREQYQARGSAVQDRPQCVGAREITAQGPPWGASQSGVSGFANRTSRPEAEGPPWGASGDRFSNCDPPSVDADNSARGSLGETFSNRGSAMGMVRPSGFPSRDGSFNGASAVKADRPATRAGSDFNRDLSTGVGRSRWDTSQDDFANRAAGIVEHKGDLSGERYSKPEADRTEWGSSRDRYSSSSVAENKMGRSPWDPARDSSEREGAVQVGNRPVAPSGNVFRSRGSASEAAWSREGFSRRSERQFAVEAGGRPRETAGGGYLSRGAEIPTATSQDRFPSRDLPTDVRPRDVSGGRYSDPEAVDLPRAASRDVTRPEQERNLSRDNYSRSDAAAGRRQAGGEWSAPRGESRSFGRGSSGPERDSFATGFRREQPSRGDRPARGPRSGPVGGGRFY